MVSDLKIKNYPQSTSDFDYVMIVGTVVIAGVTKKSKSYWAAIGYYHWILEEPKIIKPEKMKGQRGWFPYSKDQ